MARLRSIHGSTIAARHCTVRLRACAYASGLSSYLISAAAATLSSRLARATFYSLLLSLSFSLSLSLSLSLFFSLSLLIILSRALRFAYFCHSSASSASPPLLCPTLYLIPSLIPSVPGATAVPLSFFSLYYFSVLLPLLSLFLSLSLSLSFLSFFFSSIPSFFCTPLSP